MLHYGFEDNIASSYLKDTYSEKKKKGHVCHADIIEHKKIYFLDTPEPPTPPLLRTPILQLLTRANSASTPPHQLWVSWDEQKYSLCYHASETQTSLTDIVQSALCIISRTKQDEAPNEPRILNPHPRPLAGLNSICSESLSTVTPCWLRW